MPTRVDQDIRSGDQRRERLGRARIQLLFTPELCGASSDSTRDSAAHRALEQLAAALPFVDVVQVRPKPLARAGPTERAGPAGAPGAPNAPGARGAWDEIRRTSASPSAVSTARAVRDWTRALLESTRELRAELGADAPLVLVNDRVDVAKLLLPEGCDGVHLGLEDTPAAAARSFLGSELLIGLSTHTMAQVAAADDLPIDYLGFGPTFATSTKGYARGLGPEAAWVAQQASSHPLFAIGGIDLENADQLLEVGRIAVSSAILTAADPARAARELGRILQHPPDEL